jgi:hypothetical protein
MSNHHWFIDNYVWLQACEEFSGKPKGFKGYLDFYFRIREIIAIRDNVEWLSCPTINGTEVLECIIY